MVDDLRRPVATGGDQRRDQLGGIALDDHIELARRDPEQQVADGSADEVDAGQVGCSRA